MKIVGFALAAVALAAAMLAVRLFSYGMSEPRGEPSLALAVLALAVAVAAASGAIFVLRR